MKKGINLGFVLVLAIALSLSLASAGFLGDLWAEITGKATDSCNNPDTWYKDWDKDGYYADTQQACSDPDQTADNKWVDNSSGGIVAGGDCVDDPRYGKAVSGTEWEDWKFNLTDTDGDGEVADNINPGAKEVCDFVDNNCSGNIDEGFNKTTLYKDFDQDGYGVEDVSTTMCGTSFDVGAANYSGSLSVPNTISPTTDYGVSYSVKGNAPPENLTEINQQASSYKKVHVGLDAVNESSHKGPDCNDSDSGLTSNETWYLDNDTDGYPGKTKESCGNPATGGPNHSHYGNTKWYKKEATYNSSGDLIHNLDASVSDCNDNNGDLYESITFHKDADGDGYYSNETEACQNPGQDWFDNSSGDIIAGGDCNESSDSYPISGEKIGENVNPGISQDTCDFDVSGASSDDDDVLVLDNDCDGKFDEDNDTDGDGYTTCGTHVNDKNKTFNFSTGESPTNNFSSNGQTGWECNDTDSSVHSGAKEVCDALDNDCDGSIDNLDFPDKGGSDKKKRGQSESCTADGTSVDEYLCNDDGQIESVGLLECSTDRSCYSGACRQCVDTDSSDLRSSEGNLTERGITWNKSYSVVGNDGSPEGKEDSCADTDTLIEYSCGSPNGIINKTNVDCTDEYNESWSSGESWSCVQGECACQPDFKLVPGTCYDGVGTFQDVNKCYNWTSTDIPATKEGYCDKDGVAGDASKFDGVAIGGEPLNDSKNYTDTGEQVVTINKSNSIVAFNWNFSRILDIRSVSIGASYEDSDAGYVVVNGLNHKKTVLVPRISESDEVCVKDSDEIGSVEDISEDCESPGEVLVDCPGSNSSYTCNMTQNDTYYVVGPLFNSGVKEIGGVTYSGGDAFDSGLPTNGTEDPLNGSGSSGNGSSGSGSSGSGSSGAGTQDKCTEQDWSCSPSDWSNVACEDGEKTRNCNKLSDCSGGVTKSETKQCSEDSGGFPWWIVFLAGGILLVALIVLFILWKSNNSSGSNSSKSSKTSSKFSHSSSSSSSSSDSSGHSSGTSNFGSSSKTGTSSGSSRSSQSSSSGSLSSSQSASGNSGSSSGSSSSSKRRMRRGISRKYQQRGRG